VTRPDHIEALRRSRVMQSLAGFDPHLAGTPPLGLDLSTSDLDILCHAPDPDALTRVVWQAFAGEEDFRVRQWTGDGRPVIASFRAQGWTFEIFGETRPVPEQVGWRHFEVERRLLALGGAGLRAAVMRERLAGAKTEPAFAAALSLKGEPYAAMLALAGEPEQTLAALLLCAGFQVLA
jgi:hypothetical protein